MQNVLWIMPVLIGVSLYFLYFVIKVSVRKITVDDLNRMWERKGKRIKAKKDRLRHYTEAFCWVPVSFSLFSLYNGLKGLYNGQQPSLEDKYVALAMISLLCFLFFLGVLLFVVSLSRRGDLLAWAEKPQQKGCYLLFGLPFLEWSLIGVAMQLLL